MPNWAYQTVSFLYEAGLAIWVAGIPLLGAIVAPTLFRRFPREKAGEVFGAVLQRYARVRAVSLVVVVAAAAMKFIVWEGGSTFGTWISIRWMFLVFMTASLVYEITFQERQIERAREALGREGREGAAGETFQRLHSRAERLMTASFVAAAGALFLD